MPNTISVWLWEGADETAEVVERDRGGGETLN